MQMNLGDLNKVWEIKTLKRKDKEDEARKILERVAKQVEPIMRKHKWRVKLLSEFCPKDPLLLGLNVNHGVHVKLRLRRPHSDLDFYPFHHVLDTMLHELCHNSHGPHNAVFYNLWDDLRKECEELINKGVTGSGQGFDLPGRRLGGFSYQPALSSLRDSALNAAQKRARLRSLLPSGPKRLGGDNSMMTALSPVQAAAMAAERRLQDDMWCASGSCDVEEVENSNDLLEKQVVQCSGSSRSCNGPDVNKPDAISRKRNRELHSDSSLPRPSDNSMKPGLVDLTTESSVSGSVLYEGHISQKINSQRKKSSHSMNINQNSNYIDLSRYVPSSAPAHCQDSTDDMDDSSTWDWECVLCTLVNPNVAPVCEVCGTLKPRDAKDKYKFWSCKFCTLENGVELEKCSACNEWRYSHGPPIAAPAPNIGT